jgi:hypothetical protein
MDLAKSLFYFIVAGLCEIGGGYLVWLWLREGKSLWFAVMGAAFLQQRGLLSHMLAKANEVALMAKVRFLPLRGLAMVSTLVAMPVPTAPPQSPRQPHQPPGTLEPRSIACLTASSRTTNPVLRTAATITAGTR